jgi:uncharacterized protein YqjF (DUF2071 family)
MTAEEILAVHDHRPFPLPKSAWIMRQEWHDLLFAHWRLSAEMIRPLIPAQLDLDLWEGFAYLGVVPFVIRNLHPRSVPSLPIVSHFPEINVRTYVSYQGIPGVWFFSLDAGNLSAVLGARFLYALPYFHAKFRVESTKDEVAYKSRRLQRPKPADFQAQYRPTSELLPWSPPAHSLDRFITERYCLYAISGGHVYRTHVHHLPWPLQNASAEISHNTMTGPLQFDLTGAPLLHFSRFNDVLVWYPKRAS